MNKTTLILCAEKFTQTSPFNYITHAAAIHPHYAGMKIFDTPLFAFGFAADALFETFKFPGIIGKHFFPPTQWLPGAKTVISFFLPYTEKIKLANSQNYNWPADEWLHGRYEGQLFIWELTNYITMLLTDAGHESVIPALDPRYKVGNSANAFTSNWSERHVAFACGLGTFGLSSNIITEKGTCGRLGSIITNADFPADARAYSGIYDYCTMCGLCIPHCPVCAITSEGKTHQACAEFLDQVRGKHNPRYGCGKCQINVPCACKIPCRK